MRSFCWGFVCLWLALAGGCSVVIGPCPGERPMDDAVMDEIDAVSKLTFDNARLDGFKNIAERPCLPAEAQVYLVKKTMNSLVFENAKMDVLLALIKNPYFLAEGKKAVLKCLDGFTFDSSRQTILEALNRRGSVPSGGPAGEIVIPPQ